jgi:hypothetical protein
MDPGLIMSTNGVITHRQDDYDEVDLPSMDAAGQQDEAAGGDFAADSDDDGGDAGCDDGGAPEMGSWESPGRAAKPYHGAEGAGGGEQSYEDLCKAYVEKYLSGVEAFLQQSGLAARVSEWQVRDPPRRRRRRRRAGVPPPPRGGAGDFLS